jgi:plastocyanin
VGSGGSSSGLARAGARALALGGTALAVALAAPAANLAAQGTSTTPVTTTTVTADPTPSSPVPPPDTGIQQSDPGAPRPTGDKPGRGGAPSAGVPPRSRIPATAAKSTGVSIVGADANSFAFSPAKIVIQAGDTVRWTNSSSASEGHTATGKGFDSGFMKQGDTYSHKFSNPGSFSYICSIHPFMKGTVTVKSSGSGGGSGGGGGGGGGGGSSNGTRGSGSSGGASGGTGGGSSSGPTTGSSSGAPGATGQLPSTGLALVPLAGVGAGLVLLGLALARRLGLV